MTDGYTQPFYARHTHNTRNAVSGHIVVPSSNTNSMKKTVIHRAIVYWNDLPLNIRLIKNKSAFKKKVQRYLLECS